MSASTLPMIDDRTIAPLLAPGAGLVALEFTADWCPPCRIMGPVVESVAAELAGVVRFGVVDADASPAIGARFGVRSLPTLIVMRDGEVVERIVGAVPRARLQERMLALPEVAAAKS